MSRSQSILNPERYAQIPLPDLPGSTAYFHPNDGHPGFVPGEWDTVSLEAPDRPAVDLAIAELERQGWECWFNNDEYAHLFRPTAG